VVPDVAMQGFEDVEHGPGLRGGPVGARGGFGTRTPQESDASPRPPILTLLYVLSSTVD
jgi:hypothetical protein